MKRRTSLVFRLQLWRSLQPGAKLFAAFDNYFGNDPLIPGIKDAGSWDLARNLLPIDDLWVFSRLWEDEQD